MTNKFSEDMTNLLNISKEEAERLHNPSISPTHLLLAILRQNNARVNDVLSQIMPNLSELRDKLEDSAKKHQVLVTPSPDEINFDSEVSRVIRLGALEATLARSEIIDSIHILMAILKAGDSEACHILEQMNITYDAMSRILRPSLSSNDEDDIDDTEDDDDEDDIMMAGDMDENSTQTLKKNKTKGKTPMLDNFGTDLTQLAMDNLLDPVVGREQEVERVTQILSRRKKNNPILIGEPGVGKSAIVEGLATRIVQHNVSSSLWNKRVVMLNMAAMVAGTKYRGQFEERINAVINELKKNPDVIVFIDEIHTMVGAGSVQGGMDAANMLKPALARGEFQCIGATTIDEFRKTIEKDGALDRRFQKVLVKAPTAEETLSILMNLKPRYEEHHHVKYTPEALTACVRLTERYVSDRSFPDKAIDVMDEAGSRMRIKETPMPASISKQQALCENLKKKKNLAAEKQNFELAADLRDQAQAATEKLESMLKDWQDKSQKNNKLVTYDTVADVVSLITGIPVNKLGKEEGERLRNLDQILKKKVIGQDDAISAIARAIQRSRVGISDPHKPVGTFMFVGPTGVGKTYLTKCLAEELFGSEENIIRLDMSEYMEKHTVSRMVGAPPGYVGYEEGGQLTEKVRRKPYSIVLLDEIEKAHPDVFNILLQVMDEGRLTDGNGTTIDFRNTIVIMTSNSGTRQIREFGHGLGFQIGDEKQRSNKQNHDLVNKALRKQFAPEFLNRLDAIIHFDQLSQESIMKIVDIELAPLLKRIKALGTELAVSEEAKELLGKKGYDVQYGVRPLKRAIQNMIEDPLADVMMSDHIPSHLEAKVKDDKIVIEPVEVENQ